MSDAPKTQLGKVATQPLFFRKIAETGYLES